MSNCSLRFLRGACLSLLPIAALAAQSNRIKDRIDPRALVVLKGNLNPRAKPEFDRGPADSSLRLPEMNLLLRHTSAQQAALDRLLQEQQDPASPSFHKWLTPEPYADQFGLSQSDMGTLVAWLQGEGFRVDYVARSRTWIRFSGTAGQVRNTFHTEIHRYQVDGETHFANVAEPSIPAALKDVALGVSGLDDFRPKPQNVTHGKTAESPLTHATDGTQHLGPGDLAIIYDIAPLQKSGHTGAGQTIVVVGETDINPADALYFRTFFGLPATNPQVVLAGADPGTGSALEVREADIDLEWAGAAAPDASILFVIASNVWTAANYAIDNSLAPIISMSYTECEATPQSALAQSERSWAQQANAEGITWIAASGDTGAAGCDSDTGILASNGLAVNIPASIPEVTGVGGTEFNEANGTYWTTNNSSNYTSALSYIPETAWNETPERFLASGGGASVFFTKPAWQTGPGVPNDNARDVPDVALAADPDHDGYYIYVDGVWDDQGGGTSAATPAFAGMVALLNQYTGSNGLGNINPSLYRLAQSAPGAFHDITTGNNIVPCTLSTPNCANGQFGYSAGSGYDRVTGLGSVDAFNLVTAWNTASVVATTTTVSANPAAISPNGSSVVTATVEASSGTTTPSGSVTFTVGSTTLGTATLVGSGGSATVTLTILGSQLSLGNNTITAQYGGDSSLSASSGMATVTVNGAVSGVTFTANPNPIISTTGAGMTTLTWNAPGYSNLVIHVNSPTGTAMTGSLPSSGSAQTGSWVTNGMQFFLVDLTTNSAIASLTVNVSTNGTPPPPSGLTFTANPNPIVSSTGLGMTTLTWNAPGYSNLVIHVNSPTGVAMTGALTSSGSAQTGNWVTDGMQFFLVDLTTNSAIASLTVHVSASGTPPPPTGVTFTANPNPIISSTGLGITTLSWNAPGYSNLVIHVNSPTGAAMTGSLPSSGSAQTGDWVTDGMQFFLVDLSTDSAIASLTVHVSASGTPPPPIGVTLTANPNPIVSSTGVGMTTLTWNAPGYSNLVIHVNSPTGTAMTGSLPSSGSAQTGDWVTNGMQFFLVDASTGATLASVTVTVQGSQATKSLVVVSVTPDPVHEQTPDADGYSWFYTVTLTETAGVETTLTSYTWDGIDYSSQIASWFGSSMIPAHGTISASLRANVLNPPQNILFTFAGQDPGTGTQWAAEITVPFLGP